jgi:hypothetical protein
MRHLVIVEIVESADSSYASNVSNMSQVPTKAFSSARYSGGFSMS